MKQIARPTRQLILSLLMVATGLFRNAIMMTLEALATQLHIVLQTTDLMCKTLKPLALLQPDQVYQR